MEKTFLIKDETGAVELTTAESRKEAILSHAMNNKVNPFFLKAQEVGNLEVRDIFVKTFVEEHFKKNGIDYTHHDVYKNVYKIREEDQFWNMMDTLLKMYIDEGPKQTKKQSDKGGMDCYV